ncbi:glycosyltransferase [Photobacterium sp. ZSDE20]|uniref:Glycosyltransferase n=1 Tax=Photobacterium pectinilyticum TaxID=2906793 RepID=A0ABT1MXL8_9GAMM|nr:glycosyltransferase [Photobacterium sp. ZSDE20]MCQ1057243.1 glycosyltransferase [Photobacterium sp. ZSDE20]MDD1821701.1 glycosyltransferase [Photobacterium sp. ZSDE20]
MRVAIAIDRLSKGGAPKVMLSLANELLTLGHEPHFLLISEENIYNLPKEINVHYLFKSNDKRLNRLFNLDKVANELNEKIAKIESEVGQFDLFLSNLDKTNLLMSRTSVKPLFFVIHASVEEELKRHAMLGPLKYVKKIRSKLALNGHHLITVSKGIEEEIRTKGRIKPASITTIYNPFDIEDIVSKSLEPNPEIPSGEYWIHIGRFVQQKRHDILFASLSKMENNLPIVLLCHKPKQARKLARKYGVEDRLIIPEFQYNPYPWIRAAKGMLLSSDFEGLPTVLIESLICGTPVVSTDCPHGPKEILLDNLAEYLVPRRDPEKLAQKADLLLSRTIDLTDCGIESKVASEVVAKQYLGLMD